MIRIEFATPRRYLHWAYRNSMTSLTIVVDRYDDGASLYSGEGFLRPQRKLLRRHEFYWDADEVAGMWQVDRD